MRILVTGTAGQVALSLIERSATRPDMEMVAIGRPELDLLQPSSVERAINAARPDLVISAAAYTAVDQAEDEPEHARAINVVGAQAVAAAAAAIDAPVIHLSTDYVFSGDKDGAYEEDDLPAPQGVYGRTKLEGEIAVAAANPRHVILRTAWVYSPFGRNFVKTMLRLAGEREELSVVDDQWGNPTSALDIAAGILHLASHLRELGDNAPFGTYHLAGSGTATWYDVAVLAMDASRARGGPHAKVNRITTADFPTRARRPANSRLSTARLHAAFGWQAPKWEASCEEVVGRLLAPFTI